jgi:hypothetical protein
LGQGEKHNTASEKKDEKGIRDKINKVRGSIKLHYKSEIPARRGKEKHW